MVDRAIVPDPSIVAGLPRPSELDPELSCRPADPAALAGIEPAYAYDENLHVPGRFVQECGRFDADTQPGRDRVRRRRSSPRR